MNNRKQKEGQTYQQFKVFFTALQGLQAIQLILKNLKPVYK